MGLIFDKKNEMVTFYLLKYRETILRNRKIEVNQVRICLKSE